MFRNADLVPFARLIEENWAGMVDEALQVAATTGPWRETEIYEGTWRLFVFYDYENGGTEAVEGNLIRCPVTRHVLKSIPGRRAASFSILDPGSRVKPHLGLDHGMLRFHCGLKVPRDCTLSAMRDHPGLEMRHVVSPERLFTALRKVSVRRYLEPYLNLPPHSIVRSLDLESIDGAVESAMLAINRLIADIQFPVIGLDGSEPIDNHPHTTEWARVLREEGILQQPHGQPVVITIDYESQRAMVRWFNTAFASEVIFPGVFAKSLSFERRKLAAGDACIFNDAFLHEARNESEKLRIVFLMDFERARYGLTD